MLATQTAPTVATKRRRSASITVLHRNFERAREAIKRIPDHTETSLSNPAFDRAAGRLGDMAARIAEMPAESVDEMLLKIDAALKEGDYVDHQTALETLRDDLRRLQARV
jgi:hypothetical protein